MRRVVRRVVSISVRRSGEFSLLPAFDFGVMRDGRGEKRVGKGGKEKRQRRFADVDDFGNTGKRTICLVRSRRRRRRRPLRKWFVLGMISVVFRMKGLGGLELVMDYEAHDVRTLIHGILMSHFLQSFERMRSVSTSSALAIQSMITQDELLVRLKLTGNHRGGSNSMKK